MMKMKSKLIKYFCAAIISGAFLFPTVTVSANADYFSIDPIDDDIFIEEILLDEEIEEITMDDWGCHCNNTAESEKLKETEPKKTESTPAVTTAPAVTTPPAPVTTAPIVTTAPAITTAAAPKTPVVTAKPVIEEIPEDEEDIADIEPIDASPVTEILETQGNPPLINPQGGNGAMIESASSGQVNREFITVQTKNGAVFYIVIDRDEKSENVYFLNAVDEYDLFAFADKFPEEVLAELEAEKGGDVPENIDNSDVADDNSAEKNPDKEKSGGNNSSMIIVVIAVLGIGGAVYFKVIKPKQSGKQGKQPAYDDEEEYEEDEPVNEDVSYDEQEDE